MLLIFLGIMMGQLLYMCIFWVQQRRKEYAYYAVQYIIFIYFLFGLSYEYIFTAEVIQRYDSWFSLLRFQPLHIFNYYLYVKFAQHYLEVPRLYPDKNAQAVIMMKGIWVCTVIAIVAWFIYGGQSRVFLLIYNVLSVFLLLWASWLIYLIYTMHTRQSNYLFRASLLLTVGLLTTYVLIFMAQSNIIPKTVSIFYPSILGVLGEIYFIISGLNYKASSKRKQLIDSQQQLIEELNTNQVLLRKKENVRNDLSLQLNKEIGITLNGINLFAEHGIQQLKAEQMQEVEDILNRIVTDSNQMVTSMADIVWVLSPGNDSLEITIQRLRHYTSKLCRAENISYEFNTKGDDAGIVLQMGERKELYGMYKEALERALTSKPQVIAISIKINRGSLDFVLEAKGEPGSAPKKTSFAFKLTLQGDAV